VSLTVDPYPYQADAVDAFLARGSLLLAFDTGVGKTLTAIAIGEELLETRQVRRVLLVVPASLKFQWAKALAQFTDLPTQQVKVKDETITIPKQDACAIIDGTPDRRVRQYAAIDSRCEYVIVGYDQLVDEWKQVRKLRCDYVVLDEASAIKTPGAKRSKAIKRHFRDAPFRLALTATPIENRPEEVFSIMQWVDEDVLGRYDFFDKTYIVRDIFGKVARYQHLDVLHEKLSPAMIRKTRFDPDVAPYMPDVDTDVWDVELDDPTWAAYKDMLTDLLAAYDGVDNFGGFNVHAHYGQTRDDKRGDKTALGRLMGIHGTMEMLLNHPELVRESARLYEETDDRGSQYAAGYLGALQPLPATSPKLNYLAIKVWTILLNPDAKLLIFCRNKMMLRLIAERFADFDSDVVIYDGDMTVREKEAAVTRFKTNAGVRLFLSSHAGAYGTDLPEANWLINYDIPWGAGLAHQIDGRHVRASSKHDIVHIRDMVCTGTVEERKLAGKKFKNRISSSVIDGAGRAGELKNDVRSLRSHAREVLELDTPLD
jgi:SNF2 family DNA or RNA helicase